MSGRSTLRRGQAIAFLFACAVALVARAALAHPLAPALLHLEELGDGRYAVLWKVSTTSYDPAVLVPQLPLDCRELSAPVVDDRGAAALSSWIVDCGAQGLAGRTIQVIGLDESSVEVLVTVTPLDGALLSAVLSAGTQTAYSMPAAARLRDVFANYGALGVEHILTGYDHLLFVVALTLLVGSLRQLVIAVTGFTLGHSLTLSLATLDVLHAPSAPIEALIAGSVVVLAVEVAARARRDTLIGRAPWLVTTIFGLLHGLGFASVLREIGLPHDATVPALAAFNVGVELGQLGIVCACLLLGVLLNRTPAFGALRDVRLAAYPIGVIAAFWTIERVAAALNVI